MNAHCPIVVFIFLMMYSDTTEGNQCRSPEYLTRQFVEQNCTLNVQRNNRINKYIDIDATDTKVALEDSLDFNYANVLSLRKLDIDNSLKLPQHIDYLNLYEGFRVQDISGVRGIGYIDLIGIVDGIQRILNYFAHVDTRKISTDVYSDKLFLNEHRKLRQLIIQNFYGTDESIQLFLPPSIDTLQCAEDFYNKNPKIYVCGDENDEKTIKYLLLNGTPYRIASCVKIERGCRICETDDGPAYTPKKREENDFENNENASNPTFSTVDEEQSVPPNRKICPSS